MTKRPSSIKGDRAGVLLGESETGEDVAQQTESAAEVGPPEAEPSEPDLAAPALVDVEEQVPAAAPPEMTPLSEAEVDLALYEEASGGEPDPGEEADPWGLDSEWPPSPEAELALFEDTVAIEAQPEMVEVDLDSPPVQPEPATGDPVPAWAEGLADVAEPHDDAQVIAEEPIPTLEEIMDDQVIGEDLISLDPADDQVGAVLPPRPEHQFYGDVERDSLAAVDIQTPEEVVPRLELPERDISAERRAELAAAASKRLSLWDEEIDAVYEQVIDQVGANDNITTDCFNQLLRARDIILRRDVARLAQAEYYIEQARARLRRAEASSKGAKRNAWWILGWGFLWAMVLISALVLLDSTLVQDAIDSLGLTGTFFNPDILLPAMVWGGLGGVVAIWYSLFKHVAQRDFDTSYNISYVGKPFFGLILGATVYMVVNLLIVSLGIWPANLPEELGSMTIAPWIVYLLAWVSGFKENRIFGVVDYAMKRVFSTREAAPPSPPMGLSS
jgi:hypothetical protein